MALCSYFGGHQCPFSVHFYDAGGSTQLVEEVLRASEIVALYQYTKPVFDVDGYKALLVQYPRDLMPQDEVLMFVLKPSCAEDCRALFMKTRASHTLITSRRFFVIFGSGGMP